MHVKISSDSTCDLSSKLIARYDIAIIPLSVIQDGKVYRDGVDISAQTIFDHVDRGGALCSTAAVNTEDYREHFARYASLYDAVIHITIGSGFSACYQNASIAAADFSNVYVVDSMNLSTGQGHLVIEAAQLAQQGKSAPEICGHLNEMRGRIEASFILDRLDYMQKGGRCSSVMALGGKLLRIKPCIAVRDGGMKMVEKYRGSFARCVEKYVKDQLKDRKDICTDRIFITHSHAAPEAVQAAREAVQMYASFAQIEETVAGCTISCHCGPGTLGILFITHPL